MLAVERKMKIVDYVKQNRTATIGELAKEFGVHEVTIRRDLTELEQEGLLKRTHGGVVIDDKMTNEPSFEDREHDQVDQKSRIGFKAAEFIEEGDHIIIDAGTTTHYLAKAIKNKKNITVFTNDLRIAAELKGATGITVLVSGGELNHVSYLLNGILTMSALEKIHVHKAFIGIPAIHSKHGLTHPKEQFVQYKKQMIEVAQEVFVLADHKKLDKISLHSIAPIQSVHYLVTGKEVTGEQVNAFEESGTTVIRA